METPCKGTRCRDILSITIHSYITSGKPTSKWQCCTSTTRWRQSCWLQIFPLWSRRCAGYVLWICSSNLLIPLSHCVPWSDPGFRPYIDPGWPPFALGPGSALLPWLMTSSVSTPETQISMFLCYPDQITRLAPFTLPYDPGLTQVQPCSIPESDCRFNLGYCWGVKGVLAFSLYIKEYIRAVPSGTICKLARKSPSWTQKSFQSNFFFTKIHLKNSPLKLTCKISYLSKTPDQNLH